MTREQRSHPRYPARLEVHLESLFASIKEHTADVSEGGLFVETERPLEPNATVGLRFFLPHLDRPVELAGRVAHTRTNGGPGPHGMGIAFDAVPTVVRHAIGDFLAELSQGEMII